MDFFQEVFLHLIFFAFSMPVLRCQSKEKYYGVADFTVQIIVGFVGLAFYGLIDFGFIENEAASKTLFVGSVLLVGNAFVARKVFTTAVGDQN